MIKFHGVLQLLVFNRFLGSFRVVSTQRSDLFRLVLIKFSVKMAGSDENYTGVIRPSNLQGGLRPGVGGKATGGLGQNRRALSTINRNVMGAPPLHCAVVHKRNDTTENKSNAATNKIPPVPIHRPITRKLAAQIASKQHQPAVEVTKPPVPVVPIRNESADCIIIDAEDYKTTGNSTVPMFVQHTEAMMEEIDRMDEEIEMEDAEDWSIVDIDSPDKKNSLAVVEYIDDIYAYYKKAEVHYKFELLEETLYLTVNLIDRFLAVQSVIRKKLQLVGITAMLLACKYEEVSVPVVEDLILISDRAYTRKEVLEMEKLMVNALQFNMTVPTAYAFMRRFLKAAQSDKKVELVSFFLIELCLVEYEMLRFPPSMLAAAAIFTAQCTLGVSKEWNKTCEKHSSYVKDQLLECSKLMVSFHQKAAIGKLTGVHRKYSTSKYGYATRCEPASFLLEAWF
ncbi:hypothetical protein RDI58_012184 [Solanum bulbocastanum]|uniref:Uncharacterized protein n=1 Tax=Solanum bulbocastanum TaxID=147425 RepID=A0AAN8TYQ5_SOLBU